MLTDPATAAAFHAIPLIVVLIALPACSGTGVVPTATMGRSKSPPLTTRVPVAPPLSAFAVKVNVPVIRLDVRVSTVIVPAAPESGVAQPASRFDTTPMPPNTVESTPSG